MRKLALLAAVVCLISCYGMKVDAQTVSHYVGPSKAIVSGAVAGGPLGMNELCVQTYGSTAYICNVKEFLHTATPTKTTLNKGSVPNALWANPEFENCTYDSSSDQVNCVVPGLNFGLKSALFPPNDPSVNCKFWSVAEGTYQGTVVYVGASGTYERWPATLFPCSSSFPIACCKP